MRIFSLFLLLFISFSQKTGAQFSLLNGDLAASILIENLALNSPLEIASLQNSRSWREGDRQITSVELSSPHAGLIRILVSAPLLPSEALEKLPVLFLTAGFLSGKESVRLIAHPGNLIVVGYQYPFEKAQIEKDPSLLFKSLRLVPAQIALTLDWLKRKNKNIPAKIHVMGVSLGSLFLPVSLRLAEAKGFTAQSTVLAFGGASFKLFFQHWGIPFGDTIENLFILHDPEIYLPQLKGPFSCIYATEDEIFPLASSLHQYDLLKGAKEIHWIPGPHIDVHRTEMIEKTMSLVIDFLHLQNISRSL